MRLRLALTIACLVASSACAGGTAQDDLGLAEAAPGQTPSASHEPPSTGEDCGDALASYAPDGLPAADDLPEGSTMAAIRERGALVAGVSADTLLMSSRNPFTGEIEGFDVDMLAIVAEAIFGEPGHLRFRVITSGERTTVLEDQAVDLVARTFTMTCERWQSVAFSAEYYNAGQKVLVADDSPAQGLEDLGGQRVCAPEDTTTLTRLEQYPDIEAVAALNHGACLALFQQGEVDAITGDDTILAGIAAQDPYAVVVGEAISEEPYGIGSRRTTSTWCGS